MLNFLILGAAGYVARKHVEAIFKTNNTRERNKIWRDIDNECKDIYWAGSCRTGVQFHNDGILSSKRVVSTILGKGW